MDIESITRKYRERGIKVTPQRLAILKSLDGDKTHPSAYDIYRRLKKDYPGLSLTTIYNTLEILKDMGEIVELNLIPHRSIYDPDTTPHNHIYCVKCKKVDDLTHDLPTNVSVKEAMERGYEVYGITVSLYGLCRGCREGGDKRGV